MNNEQLNKKVDETIHNLELKEVPELDEFFYTRLKHRIENSVEEVFSFRKMALKYSFVAVLFIANLYFFMSGTSSQVSNAAYEKEVALNDVAGEYFSTNIRYE